jgi:hypothetical protein
MKNLDFLKRPAVLGLLAFIIGLFVGLFVLGWGLWPVVWTDAAPSDLRPDLQQDYLRMAIDSYKANPDNALAQQRYQALGAAGSVTLKAIGDNPGKQEVNSILSFTNVVQGTQVPASTTPGAGGTPSKPSSVTSYVLIFLAILLVGVVFIALLKYLLPIFRRGTPSTPTPAMRARELTSNTEMTDYAAMGEEPPISQFVTTYVLGDDLFDDSFSIDSPSGEFLGECGIGISETIGVGDPKKVTAFEVWLFDKNDIQTVTKVLMSGRAFNDPATYQRLEAKGEPCLVERSKQVVLETAALQLVATVSDMEYGQGAMPEQSYFERLTLEIAVWPKPATPQ